MHYTIGQLKTELTKYEPKLEVKFENGEYIGDIISWRGSYDEPSLDTQDEPSTVGSVINSLNKALLGEEYRGYKGGYYAYDSNQRLWGDSYGNYSCLAINSVEPVEDHIVLRRNYSPY